MLFWHDTGCDTAAGVPAGLWVFTRGLKTLSNFEKRNRTRAVSEMQDNEPVEAANSSVWISVALAAVVRCLMGIDAQLASC